MTGQCDQLSAVFLGPGQIDLRREPIPIPGPGEVRVRLLACGICTFERRLFAGPNNAYPIVPGHEAIGIIDEIGPGADPSLRSGQPAVVAFFRRCRRCHPCRTGQSQLCERRRRVGADGIRRVGGLARFAVVGDWQIFEWPDGMDPILGTLVEPLACAVHSLHQADLRFAEDVLVLGGGTMGQLHVALARLRGARIVLSEPDAAKRDIAQKLGAHILVDPTKDDPVAAMRDLTGGRGADAVFVTFGSQTTADQAKAAVRTGGRVILFGSFPKEVPLNIDPNRVHRQEVSYLGAANQAESDWQEALRLIGHKLLDLRLLISKEYSLDNLTDALQYAVDQSRFRTVIHCGDIP